MERRPVDNGGNDNPTPLKAKELSLVFIPEHLTEVMKSNPEQLQAVKIAGGYVIRLIPMQDNQPTTR